MIRRRRSCPECGKRFTTLEEAVLAVVKLGATAGMLNHHQRGEVLNHSQKLLDSTVLIAGSECREALESFREATAAEDPRDELLQRAKTA